MLNDYIYDFDNYIIILYQTEVEYYSKFPEHRFIAYLHEIPEVSLHEYGSTREEAIKNLKVQFYFFQKEIDESMLYTKFPEPLTFPPPVNYLNR